MLVPKSVVCIKNYTRQQFMKDFISGIIVAVIAMPLAIAFGIASGVSPEKGLYTAVIGGFIVSLLGGSRVQIGGPTGAFVVIVFGIIQKYGFEGMVIATIMAGCFLVIMGLLRLGSLIKYIPSAITTGFTNGIAIVIFSTQVKDLLGLKIKAVPSQFADKWVSYISNIRTIHPQSVAISIITIGVILLWPKISKKLPGTFIALIVVTILAKILNLDVPTIGNQFGHISSSFPKFSLPAINIKMINDLILPACTITILGSVESLLSAVVADGMIGSKHNSNMELIAQGIANIFSGAFGGIPVTGAIARTAANVKNGGRTPVAGIIHAIALLGIMIVFMPYVKMVPMAALAGILVVVSYNMGEWEVFARVSKAPKSDAFVFIVTFLLTMFMDLVVAIGVGVVLSSFLFMRKMAEIADVKCVMEDIMDDETTEIIDNVKMPEHVTVYEISGPFFFGAANKFVSAIREMGTPTRILIVKMGKVPFMDSTAYHSFEMLHQVCKKNHTKLILLQLQEQPKTMLTKYGFIEVIGEDNFCDKIDEAVDRANHILNTTKWSKMPKLIKEFN